MRETGIPWETVATEQTEQDAIKKMPWPSAIPFTAISEASPKHRPTMKERDLHLQLLVGYLLRHNK